MDVIRNAALAVSTGLALVGFGTAAEAAVLTPSDAGDSFTVLFSCDVGDPCPDAGNTPPVDLSATAIFTLDSVITSGLNFQYTFSVDLTNTTPTASRITALGFARDPEATVSTTTNVAGGPTFTVGNGFIPGFNGVVEICAYVHKNCQSAGGGASNGIQSGQTDEFGFRLTTTSSSLELSNFAVRFASVQPGGGSFGFKGIEQEEETNVIPLPAGLPLLAGGIALLGAASRVRRNQA